jgi:hypothetical protein
VQALVTAAATRGSRGSVHLLFMGGGGGHAAKVKVQSPKVLALCQQSWLMETSCFIVVGIFFLYLITRDLEIPTVL